jgi:hypothetical protein
MVKTKMQSLKIERKRLRAFFNSFPMGAFVESPMGTSVESPRLQHYRIDKDVSDTGRTCVWR